jgi:hypothetical protein
VKARTKTKHTLHFFDSDGVVVPAVESSFVVRLYLPDGTLVSESPMSLVTEVAHLFLSDPIPFEESAPHLDVKFVHSDTTVVATDSISVGTPVGDHPLGEPAVISLAKSVAGGDDKVVSLKLIDSDGEPVLGKSKASYTGDVSISTIAASPGDSLTIITTGGGDAPVSKTATIDATSATAEGENGSFAPGALGDTITISVNGGPTRTVNLDGVGAGVAAYAAALNNLFRGISVSVSAGELVLTTDRQGLSASIVLTDSVGDFTAKTGIAEGSHTVVAGNNNVSDTDAITQLELKTILQADLSVAAPGDLLEVTWSDDDEIILSVTAGNEGADSKLDLSAGTATLIDSLGLSKLGTQGGELAVTGSDGISAQALYSSESISYRASYEFVKEGDWFAAWYVADNVGDNPPPLLVESIWITKQTGLQPVKLIAGTGIQSGNNGKPHKSTTIVVSDADGKQIDQLVTNSIGEATVNLAPGEYVATLFKTGLVFSNNNFSLSVHGAGVAGDPFFAKSPGGEDVQNFQLITGTFEPTITENISPAPLCTLVADIYRMTGDPLRNATVQVHLLSRPEVFSGVGVFDTQKAYFTDSNGHVELTLVQGVKVEVSIAPLSVRRIITVPTKDVTEIDGVVWDGESDVNLLTLLSDSEDVFDVLRPNIAPAPRRTM